jgi:hypothetical protein
MLRHRERAWWARNRPQHAISCKRRGVDAAIFVDVPCRASGVGYAARDAISGCLDAAQCQGSSVCSS